MVTNSIGNPHIVYNAAISSQNNMFISSSLAVVIAGFSRNFKNKNIVNLIQILCVFIFAISVYIGFSADYDFIYYLDHVKDKLPSYIPIDSWYRMGYIVYLYTVIITIVGSLYFIQHL